MSGFEPDCHAHFSGPADPERVALVSNATVKKLMGRDLKIYVRGTINDAGQIEVIERVSEQKW